MIKKTIRSVGDIYIDSQIADGHGARIANEFLAQLIMQFAKYSVKHMRATDFFPFVYKERQLHSILAPALFSFTDSFLMESPVRREWSATSDEKSTENNHGWVDYSCNYRNLAILLEIKHGFISSKHGQLRKHVKEEWQTALAQLDAIEKEAKLQSQWTNGTLRMALHILPLFETCNKREAQTLNDLDNLFAIRNRTMEELERKPNWSAVWRLHEQITGPYDYANGTECYPGVLFVSHVSELTK